MNTCCCYLSIYFYFCFVRALVCDMLDYANLLSHFIQLLVPLFSESARTFQISDYGLPLD